MTPRVATAGMVSGLAAVLCISAIAWACTADQPRIYGLQLQMPSGGESIVKGDSAGATPVFIRWNSRTGPILAEAPVAADGSFSVTVRIPAVSPGVYLLVATAGEFGIARTPVEVVSSSVGQSGISSAVPNTSSDLWTGFDRGAVTDGRLAPGQSSLPDRQSVSATGLTLVAIGLVALLCFGAVTVRYRRGSRST